MGQVLETGQNPELCPYLTIQPHPYGQAETGPGPRQGSHRARRQAGWHGGQQEQCPQTSVNGGNSGPSQTPTKMTSPPTLRTKVTCNTSSRKPSALPIQARPPLSQPLWSVSPGTLGKARPVSTGFGKVCTGPAGLDLRQQVSPSPVSLSPAPAPQPVPPQAHCGVRKPKPPPPAI